MDFNDIMSAELAELNNEQQSFIVLHKTIMANGNAAYMSAVQMARGLKEMRDSGRYKAGGFDTFGEYAESACGIKERQAYNYISIIENLSGEFLQSTAKIGVSKLALLASMSAKDRDDLVTEHGEELESISTKELDKLKKEYEGRIKQLQFDFEEQIKKKELESVALEKNYDVLMNDKLVLKAEIEELKKNPALNDEVAEDIKRLEGEKIALEQELEQLRNAPPKPDDKAERELEKKKEEIKKLKEAKRTAEKALAEAQEKADKEMLKAIEKERAEAKKLEVELIEERKRLETEAKKAKIASDPFMSEFKVKFAMWQELGNRLKEITTELEEDNAEKCRKAFSTVIGGWSNEKA